MNKSKEEFIARIRYLGWICFQLGAKLPLHDVPSDYSISKERLESLMASTQWILEHPEATPEDNHLFWMLCKEKQGYKYGKDLNIKLKTHPSMVSFSELPEVEKKKDEMDILMTRLGEELWNNMQA